MDSYTQLELAKSLINLDDVNQKNKFSYTGTHGTGKTTSVFELSHLLKKEINNRSIHVITENASESPFKINKETTKDSQLWIFSQQLTKELELGLKYNILVCDRTIVDCIAYTKVAGFHSLVTSMIEVAKEYVHTYDKIFIKVSDNNDYHFHDGIRDGNDTTFRKNVENELLFIYSILTPYMKNEDVLVRI